MTGFDPRLAAAMAKQMDGRARALARGAQHVGWKLGVGERERIGGAIAVGHLTSETVLANGATHSADPDADLRADAEAVVEFAQEVDGTGEPDDVAGAIAAFGAALEIVDLAPVPGEPDALVAANVFHRAVVFRALDAPPSGEIRLLVDDAVRGAGAWPDDLVDRLTEAARVLALVGERFRAGDRVITGSIVQVPIAIPCVVGAEFDGLATVRLRVEPRSQTDAAAPSAGRPDGGVGRATR